MPRNFLYNTILKAKTNTIPFTHAQPIFLSDQNEERYVLLELALPETQWNSIGEYTLTHHHLSVYEQFKEGREKSPYHYTAYFCDKAGKRYRLHVYFGAKDHIIGKPCLDEITADGFNAVPCEAFHDSFKHLAHFAKTALVDELKGKQHDIVANYWHQYKTLEQQATVLSKDLDGNKESYLVCIEKLIELLNELNPFLDNVDKVRGLLTYWRRVQSYLEEQGKEHQAYEYPLEDSKEPIESISIEPVVAALPQKKLLSSEIKSLREKLEFIKAIKGKTAEKVHLIKNLNDHLLQIEIDLGSREYQFALQDLRDLQIIKEEIESTAKVALEQCLMNEQYEEARKLEPFYHLVSKKVMNFALGIKKHALIDFLLQNRIISAEYKHFEIRGVRYQSMLDYLMQIPKDDGVIHCINILLNHGLSLNSPLMAKSLSFAELMHFNETILDNSLRLGLTNPRIYQQLNDAWGLLADDKKEDNTQKNQLMLFNHEYARDLSERMDKRNLNACLEVLHTQYQSRKKMGKEAEKLLQDPEISQLTKEIERLRNEYKKKLPGYVKGLHLRTEKKNAQLDNGLKQGVASDAKSKESVLDKGTLKWMLKKQIDELKEKHRLLAVKKKAHRMGGGGKPRNLGHCACCAANEKKHKEMLAWAESKKYKVANYGLFGGGLERLMLDVQQAGSEHQANIESSGASL